LHLRNFKWTDIAALSDLLNKAGPHGHRDCPRGVDELRALLEYPRVQPKRNMVLAISGDDTLGYAIVEPEKNIGRSVIGLATAPDDSSATKKLLDWAVNRAGEEAPLVHLAVRDHESALSGSLGHQNWTKVRKYLKLVSKSVVSPAPALLPDGFTARTMLGLNEVPELTYLQNESFKSHFGYSPNTEDEIKASLLASGAGVHDVVMIHDSHEQLVAYCWTVTSDRSGSAIGRIGMTGVLPRVRKIGLGRAIAEAGFNHLVRQRVGSIELDVDSGNAPALRIYSSLGFSKSSELNWWEQSL
jgi:mycothiol synthase